MKRWMVPAMAGVVVLLGTAGACDPPPPPGWVRPEVQDLTVSPTPVVPGEPFTLSATLVDDHQVAWIDVWFRSPTGRESRPCELPAFDSEGDPQTRVDVAVPCQLPEFALNGTWTVVMNVYDGETFTGHGAGAGQAVTTFEALGGSNDDEPPVVEAFTIDPASPIQGQPFTVTVRVSDDHLVTPSGYVVMNYSNTHLRRWDCESGPAEQLSPTQQEFVFTCPGVPELAAGPYNARFALSDVNGNSRPHTAAFDIVDP